MSRHTLTHLPDQTLLRELKALVAQDRATTAMLIAHLGEVDARRLYAPAGYPSMFDYCVRDLHFSDQSAFNRIRVARLARQYPAIYGMLADGRLNLSALVMLSVCMTPENTDELPGDATHKAKAGIEQLLAARFPPPDLPTLIEPIAPPLSHSGVVPEPFNMETPPGGRSTRQFLPLADNGQGPAPGPAALRDAVHRVAGDA